MLRPNIFLLQSTNEFLNRKYYSQSKFNYLSIINSILIENYHFMIIVIYHSLSRLYLIISFSKLSKGTRHVVYK